MPAPMSIDVVAPAARGRPRRCCLSVPGSNPRMQAKAATLTSDQVVLDLEDAVAPSEKPGARGTVAEALRSQPYRPRMISVRINGLDTPWCYRDVVEVVEAAGEYVDTILVPKVESAADVLFVDRLLSQIEMSKGWPVGRIGIEVQIESAGGVQNVDEISKASPRLVALLFGPGDLAASLGLAELTIGAAGAERWHYVLMRILVAARAAGLQTMDGPYAVLHDEEGLRRAARATAAIGFDGKWAIHPDQIPIVTEAFTPDAALYRKAEGIIAAYEQALREGGRGAVRYEGDMIDEATRKMAEVVARRGRLYGLSTSSG